jgi:ribosome-interacting GTPase 1
LKIELTTKASTQVSKSALKPIQRQGAGRILLVGGPNVGKSQLLAALTRAKPLVADYPYSTQIPMPGMLSMEDCPMQLIDLPPISNDYFYPDSYDLVRSADLIFWVIDVSSDTLIEDSQAVLDRFQRSKTRLGLETGPVASEVGTTTTQTLVLLNKIDSPSAVTNIEWLDRYLKLDFDRVHVSGLRGDGLEQLPQEAFRRLGIVRVYAKDPRDREPDMTRPYFLKRGQTLVDFAGQIHGDLIARLKQARVWNASHSDCAIVKPDYQPSDKDAIELQLGT